MPESLRPLTVAFVLASYVPDAPAGMERATAALAHGLHQLGHRALILTTASPPDPEAGVIRLQHPRVTLPCDDHTLRAAIQSEHAVIVHELAEVFNEQHVDLAVYADALWGLGRAAAGHRTRQVLAMHVVGHDEDLAPALAHVERVITPSRTVLDQARERGYDTSGWSIVPNALLHDTITPADTHAREILRQCGPIRVLARLGPEKNVPALLQAGRLVERSVEIVLAEAGFETRVGAQRCEWDRVCSAAAQVPFAAVRGGGLSWREVPGWLAGAAAVIVPSLRETFSLVALEAMSVGTPVIAYEVGNLPALLGTGGEAGGVLVPRRRGEYGLWSAVRDVLADPLRYADLSRAAYYRSRDYRPAIVAEIFVKAVR